MPTKSSSLPRILRDEWIEVGALGEGGQAIVTEIQHRETGARCALKCLRRKNAYASERLTREIAVLKRLQHPNVVQLLDVAEDGSWYTMPKGIPLKEYWRSRRDAGMPSRAHFDESVSMIRGILSGLAAAHDINLVHRDVKPSNIVVVDDVPKVADFGIVHDPEKERLTEKPAVNAFAPHVPSLYSPGFAPKLIDCFGAATLWAWMLALDANAAHGRYHWRWHMFIDEPRCEISRAVLAVCSDDRHAPKDASALLGFLERDLGIASRAMVIFEQNDVSKVAEAQSVAKAMAVQSRVALQTLVATIAQSIKAFVDAVSGHCDQLAERLQLGGVDIHVRRPGGRSSGHAPFVPTPLEELLTEAAAPLGRTQVILSISARSDPTDFSMQVRFLLQWHKHPHEDGSRASLVLAMDHSIPELRRER